MTTPPGPRARIDRPGAGRPGPGGHGAERPRAPDPPVTHTQLLDIAALHVTLAAQALATTGPLDPDQLRPLITAHLDLLHALRTHLIPLHGNRVRLYRLRDSARPGSSISCR